MKHTKPVIDTIDEWVAAGERVAVATVVDTKKSAPQPPGRRWPLAPRGRIAGAVSGGCVEGAVVEVAEAVIAGAAPALLHYGVADDEAWDVGLPCGGEVSVFVEAYGGLQTRFHALSRAGARAALVTAVADVPAVDLGAKLLVLADGATEGTLGSPALDAAAVELASAALWTERSRAGRGGWRRTVRRRRRAATAPGRLRGRRLRRPTRRGRGAGGLADVRDRPARAVRDRRAVPGRRARDRRLAGRGADADRAARPRERSRGPHPRPKARRRRAAGRARLGGGLRRRDGQPPRPGTPPRAADSPPVSATTTCAGSAPRSGSTSAP